MNRRSFLKAIAAIGAAAAIPSALIPEWKRQEPEYLTYRGARLVYDKHCQKNTVYILKSQTLAMWKVA